MPFWAYETLSLIFNLNKSQFYLKLFPYLSLSFILNFRLPIIFRLHLEINENRWNVWLEILRYWAVRLNWKIFEYIICGTKLYQRAIWLQNQGCKRMLWRKAETTSERVPTATYSHCTGCDMRLWSSKWLCPSWVSVYFYL